MSGGVIGLDLAQRYGWAAVDVYGRLTASGHRDLRSDLSLGERCHQLTMSIADLVTEYRPDFLAIEKPIHAGRFTAFATARALYAYAACAEMVAHIHQVGYAELARSTCTKRVLGNGRADKAAGVLFARHFKPLLNSDDEADAILVAFAAHGMREGRAAA